MVSTDVSAEVLNWIADGEADAWAKENGYISKSVVISVFESLLREAECQREDEIYNESWIKVLAYDVQAEVLKLIIHIFKEDLYHEGSILLPAEIE